MCGFFFEVTVTKFLKTDIVKNWSRVGKRRTCKTDVAYVTAHESDSQKINEMFVIFIDFF